MGQNLFFIEQQEANTISNYNPYLDAALYWATVRGGDGNSLGSMCTPLYSSIGIGVAYGNGEIVICCSINKLKLNSMKNLYIIMLFQH